jgi:hypothetical protein
VACLTGAPIQRVLPRLETDAYTLDPWLSRVVSYWAWPVLFFTFSFGSLVSFRFGLVRLLRPFISAKYRSSKGTGEAKIQALTKISIRMNFYWMNINEFQNGTNFYRNEFLLKWIEIGSNLYWNKFLLKQISIATNFYRNELQNGTKFKMKRILNRKQFYVGTNFYWKEFQNGTNFYRNELILERILNRNKFLSERISEWNKVQNETNIGTNFMSKRISVGKNLKIERISIRTNFYWTEY